ncbi:MAG TPA: DUF4139 domain-containing protein, partial [Polyangiaceae bacterium]|nr:DUF4139 domain-containing protein [Polyangiaceae bacterium]
LLAALLLAGLGCSRSAPPASPGEAAIAGHYRSTAAERQRVSVTVYNSNVALVREQRRVRLGTGRVALAYEDVAASMLPATVVLSALDAPSALVVREQNYRYDLLTPEKLLEKYVGRRVSLARYDAVAGKDELREAEVLASSNGPVLRVGGEILTQLPDRISFAELPPGLVPRPTLVWLLDSAREEQSVELSYLTENLSWHADYVLALSPDQQQADLSSWVTLDNRSGASFAGAQLQLVAGDVQRVAPARQEGRHSRLGGRRAGAAPEFKQEKLFEYHLYDLERPTDLLDQEQKQLRLFDAPGIAVQKKLVLRSTNSYSAWQSGSGAGAASEQRPPSVVLELENSEAQGLGMPLPKGVVRVYQRDASGGQQFVGQNRIEHTPRDEKLELEIGRALDVTSERRQLRRMARGKCQLESEWRIELRNAKDQAVVVEVVESMDFSSFQLAASSLPAEPRDARTLAFRVPVPARGKAEVSYRVIVTWCG